MSGRKKRKLSTDSDIQVTYETLRDPDYANLPEVVMREVLSYLNPRELRRASRVCRRWNNLCRYSVNWNRVDLQGLNLKIGEIQSFLEKLPSYIRRLRIYLDAMELPAGSFPKILEILSKKCPNLEVLHFENCKFQAIPRPSCYQLISHNDVNFQVRNRIPVFSLKLTIGDKYNACLQKKLRFPKSLRVLRFLNTEMRDNLTLSDLSSCHLPNIEILDFTRSNIYFGPRETLLDTFPLLKELHISRGPSDGSSGKGLRLFLGAIPKLKILRLNSVVKGEELKLLQGCGQNLVQLHLCDTKVRDEDLDFIDPDTFPNLELLCFRRKKLTEEGYKKLLNCCKSLKKVFVGKQNPDNQNPDNQNPDNQNMDHFLISREHRCDQILRNRIYF